MSISTTARVPVAPAFSPARLAEARRAAGLRQREVAAAVRRDIRHYQRIESGHVSPTAALLGVLAMILAVRIDDLFELPEVGTDT
jgi:transcriptional regulator with XRE-family HTH domain